MPPATFIEPTASSQQTNTGRGPDAVDGSMIDPFGRHITYLRLSVTDRCDFRCVYCMAENMTFLPKADLLTLEELDRLCSAFIRRGERKLRLTGGEPLVRRNVMWLFGRLARHLDSGALNDLTLTTNGSQLPRFANELSSVDVRRVNISMDTLDPAKIPENHTARASLTRSFVASMQPKMRASTLKSPLWHSKVRMSMNCPK